MRLCLCHLYCDIRLGEEVYRVLVVEIKATYMSVAVCIVMLANLTSAYHVNHMKPSSRAGTRVKSTGS